MMKVKNMMAVCSSFSPVLKGMAKLQSIRARAIFNRHKFEKFIQTEW
jgi:hypothetical protein